MVASKRKCAACGVVLVTPGALCPPHDAQFSRIYGGAAPNKSNGSVMMRMEDATMAKASTSKTDQMRQAREAKTTTGAAASKPDTSPPVSTKQAAGAANLAKARAARAAMTPEERIKRWKEANADNPRSAGRATLTAVNDLKRFDWTKIAERCGNPELAAGVLGALEALSTAVPVLSAKKGPTGGSGRKPDAFVVGDEVAFTEKGAKEYADLELDLKGSRVTELRGKHAVVMAADGQRLFLAARLLTKGGQS